MRACLVMGALASAAGGLGAVGLGAVGLGAVALPGQEPPARFVVEAAILSEAPTLDGRLTEKVWEEAAVLAGFVQVEPAEGAPGTERTEVRIGYDAQRLYLGIRCFDSRPETISAATMDRDGALADEDSISIVLDTFHDRKSAYLFALNPLGAQVDALVRNEGDDVSYSWDGIWRSATSRDAEGWSAEIAIPFRTLRFPRLEQHTWGINVQRLIVSKREYQLWKPVPRYSASDALFKMAQAGELTGLTGLRQGRSFDVKPYVLARRDDGDTRGEKSTLDAGVEVRRNLTSDLVLDLTYNLDFAEAEADRQQINLTRFKLFFPEKRDFFLEGADLFYFGEREDFLKKPERIFFFSRRIGLTEDGQREIPVLGGVKLAGRLGGFGVGLLNLTTDELTYRDRAGDERFEPRTSYTVVRLKRDVLEKSAIGLMWLDKAVSGGRDNRGIGVDWDFAFGDSFKTGGFWSRTDTPGLEGDDWAASADVVWDGKRSFVRSIYSEVGENFNPEMGFFTRFGIREWRTNAVYEFRPDFWGMRSIYVFDDFVYLTDREGRLETRVNRLETNFLWQNRSGFAFKVFDYLEVLKSDFEIADGVIIPPGEYRFQNVFFGVESPRGKKLWVFGRVDLGELYDGDYFSGLLETEIRPLDGLISRLTFEHTDVDLPAGDFEIDLLTARVVYSVSPRLSFRAFAQWSREEDFTANVLAQWLYKPGAALYVVYNEFRDLGDRPAGGSRLRDRALSSKMSFFF